MGAALPPDVRKRFAFPFVERKRKEAVPRMGGEASSINLTGPGKAKPFRTSSG
jgi:hypothetical protein